MIQPGAQGASPSCGSPPSGPPLIQALGLGKRFPLGRGFLGLGAPRAWLRAVEDLSLEIQAGRTLGLVGESGCGKSTVGRMLVGMLEPSQGLVRVGGRELRMEEPGPTPLRRQLQMVFQDPASALNPLRTLRQALAEPFELHELGMAATEREARVEALARRVGLDPGHLDRLPGAFSGGQRQRAVIARAVALEPRFLFADEPVSSLDVSVRAQVLNLLVDLQRERGLACLFVSHDLRVVRHMADEVAVMHLGRLVERAPAARLFSAPRHPYTQALLASMPPLPGEPRPEQVVLQGELPSPLAPPPGCPFHPRCPRYAGLGGAERRACRTELPELRGVAHGSGHLWACHWAGGAE